MQAATFIFLVSLQKPYKNYGFPLILTSVIQLKTFLFFKTTVTAAALNTRRFRDKTGGKVEGRNVSIAVHTDSGPSRIIWKGFRNQEWIQRITNNET